jgi:hypothetical protein
MQSAASRSPIILGGTTYDVSPLTDEAHDSLNEWVRSTLAVKHASLITALTGDDKRVAVEASLKMLSSVTFMSPEGIKLMGTQEGVARMLWEGIRRNHSDVSFEKIKKELVSPEQIRAATAKFEEQNLQKVGPTNPKARSLRRKKSTR